MLHGLLVVHKLRQLSPKFHLRGTLGAPYFNHSLTLELLNAQVQAEDLIWEIILTQFNRHDLSNGTFTAIGTYRVWRGLVNDVSV